MRPAPTKVTTVTDAGPAPEFVQNAPGAHNTFGAKTGAGTPARSIGSFRPVGRRKSSSRKFPLDDHNAHGAARHHGADQGLGQGAEESSPERGSSDLPAGPQRFPRGEFA